MIVNNPNISNIEFEALKEAISDITILIAGADGDIDEKEIEWGEKITKIRSYSLPENLKDFYAEVGKDFFERVNGLIKKYPGETEVRCELIEKKLAALNPILAKLDQNEGAELYNSYLTFAKHVAKANGGFLGFFSVSYEESKYMDLPMIDKIEYVLKEDE